MSQQQPLISHLLELRSKLLKSIASVLIVFICSVYWANDIYHYMAIPLMQSLPLGGSMIATDVAAPFFAPFKLTLVLSFFVAVPYVLFQIWSFVAPGLYKHEKRLVMPLLFSSTVLFYLGIAFAYYVVFPVVFGFFANTAPEGVQVATDISSYLDFVLKLFFAFGLSFDCFVFWMAISFYMDQSVLCNHHVGYLVCSCVYESSLCIGRTGRHNMRCDWHFYFLQTIPTKNHFKVDRGLCATYIVGNQSFITFLL